MATHVSNLVAWSEVAGPGEIWRAGAYSKAQVADGDPVDIDPVPLAGHAPTTTRYLRGLELAVPLPSVDSVDWLKVWIKRRKSGNSPSVTDNSLLLIRGGTPEPGVNGASATEYLTAYDYEAHLFDAADLTTCGFTLTAETEFNAANFGIDFQVAIGEDTLFEGALPEIDHIYLEFGITIGGGSGGGGGGGGGGGPTVSMYREPVTIFGAPGIRVI